MEDKLMHELYDGIDANQKARLAQRFARAQAEPMPERLHPNLKPVLASLLVLVVLAASTFAAVPAVRAAVLQYFRNVAGVNFVVEPRLPDYGNPNIVNPQRLSLDQALQAFKQDLSLPAEIADVGALRNGTVEYYAPGLGMHEGISGFWGKVGFSVILPMTPKDATLVGTDQFVPVKLAEGVEGVQYQGGWNSDKRTWDNDPLMGYTVQWQQNGLEFHLRSHDLNQVLDAAKAVAALN